MSGNNQTTEELKALLNERDAFIVSKGLWQEFIESLMLQNPGGNMSRDVSQPTACEHGDWITDPMSGIRVCAHCRADQPETTYRAHEDAALARFFEKVKTAEMAQKVARRLGKPHGAFADFAVRWIEAMDALDRELQEKWETQTTEDVSRGIRSLSLPSGDTSPADPAQRTLPKAYAVTVYDADGKLIAAEFVEGLSIKTLDSAERWADQGHEFRIKRVMETTE